MSAKSWSSRVALWAAVCALLLKAAAPMLASAASGVRGVGVADICTVYGVAVAAPASHDDERGPQGSGSNESGFHSGDHCALTALAGWLAHDPLSLSLPVPQAVRDTAASQVAAWIPRVAWTAAQPRAPPRV